MRIALFTLSAFAGYGLLSALGYLVGSDMDEWDMDPSAGDIELECPACSASVGYNDVISTAAGGARCPVCGEESEPDEWFE